MRTICKKLTREKKEDELRKREREREEKNGINPIQNRLSNRKERNLKDILTKFFAFLQYFH